MKRVILLWTHDGHLISVFPLPNDKCSRTAMQSIARQHEGRLVWHDSSPRIVFFRMKDGRGPEQWLKIEVRMLAADNLHDVLNRS